MAELLKPLGLAALIAFGAPALAQDTTAPADSAAQTTETTAETPAETPTEAPTGGNPLGLEMGEQLDENGNPVQQQPESYIDEVFGDWSRECIRIPGNEGPDPCEMVQLLRASPEEDPLGKVSIARLPDNLKTVAGVTVIMPLGVVLTQQLTIGVDSAAPRRYPFQYCVPIGCFAQFGISAGELASFKNGAKSIFTVVPMADPSTKAPFDVSLSGFTAAFDSLPVLQIPAQ